MKIITEPTVYLIGKQTVVDDELQRFLDDHGIEWESDSENACEVIAEVSGRVCYLSYKSPRPGGNKAYLGHIIESQHGSVLSHAVFNFMITGVSRSLTHELIRHSVGTATSQLSQRYVDESVAEYVCPDIIYNDPQLFDIWKEAVTQSNVAYKILSKRISNKLEGTETWKKSCDDCKGEGEKFSPCQSHGDDPYYDCLSCKGYGYIARDVINWLMLPPNATKTDIRKAARQAARSVLPNATETKLMFTMNVRACRNILEQRGSRHADPEIRKLAKAIYDIVIVEAPNLFYDYQLEQLPDGTYEITTQYRKV